MQWQKFIWQKFINLRLLRFKNAKPTLKDGKLVRNVLTDGDGLRLIVEPDGARSWDSRYTSPVTGKERFMGLGQYTGLGTVNDVTLAKAREAADEARKQVKAKIDPQGPEGRSRAS